MSDVAFDVACAAPFCSRNVARSCPACKARVCRNHSRMLSTMKDARNSSMHRCSQCGNVAHLREWLTVEESLT